MFRSAATLVTSGTANIVGGDTCDIWWQVPSSATLGTSTSLKGNILALTSITMNTGASLTGRALARNGAVTLGSNTINQSCAGVQARTTSTSSSSSTSSTGSSVCPVVNSVTPSIIEAKRVDADSVFVSWGPYSDTNTFNVRYGLANGNWLWNTNVTGFSTTLNDLPANQPIWIQVAATNSCSTGIYGGAVVAGGSGGSGGSNSLIPLLPNTGFGPRDNSIFLWVHEIFTSVVAFLLG